MTIIVVGNKSDLKSHREVRAEEGLQFAQKYGLQFIETSAKENKNVSLAFEKSASIILQKVVNKELTTVDDSDGVKLGNMKIGEPGSPQGGSGSVDLRKGSASGSSSKGGEKKGGCC